ncbi:MAG TPA: penicillin acylase family protein [Spirochaetota bacterium]|nr:penicillin acylase family protein [Spirochaetota bacterium]
MDGSLMSSKGKKWFLAIVICILSLVAIAFAILYITYSVEKIKYDAEVLYPIKSKIIITRTENGEPLISAQNIEDLFFGLGYVHGQDRLNLMEYERALAMGTIDEFENFEDSHIITQLAYIAGFKRESENILSKLSPDEITLLKKYTEGINLIRQKRHLALTTKKEWEPIDVLAILVMREWVDSFLSNPELYLLFSEKSKLPIYEIFKEREKFFFFEKEDIQQVYILKRIKGILEKYYCPYNQGFAIVGVSKDSSAIGFSYISSYNSYPGWYPLKVNLNGTRIEGTTWHGLPFFFTFKNDNCLFSHFNLRADTQDFYKFKTRHNNGTLQYSINGLWKDFKTLRIPLTSNPSLSYITMASEKGPIFSDLITSGKETENTLSISSVYPGVNYVRLLLTAPFEQDGSKIYRNILSCDASLKSFILKTPKDSMTIISGYALSKNPEKSILIDGSKAVRANPSKITIARTIKKYGLISSSMYTVADSSIVYKPEVFSNETASRYMADLLDESANINEETLQNILGNTYSPTASLYLPFFKNSLSSNPLTSAKMSRLYFNDWDMTVRQKLQAPVIFFTLLQEFIKTSLEDNLDDEIQTILENSPMIYEDFYYAMNQNSQILFDDKSTIPTETKELIFDRAFINTMRLLNRRFGPLMENWQWGILSQNHYKIPNATSTFFSKFFKIENNQTAGYSDTIFSTFFDNNFTSNQSTSLYGIISKQSFRYKMNYGYSSSVFSDFYYGKISKTESEPIEKYRTTIENK